MIDTDPKYSRRTGRRLITAEEFFKASKSDEGFVFDDRRNYTIACESSLQREIVRDYIADHYLEAEVQAWADYYDSRNLDVDVAA